MDYYLKNAETPCKMMPSNYNDYIELLEQYMTQERHSNIFTQFEQRREVVYRLKDISEHCFRLVDDPSLQTYYSQQEEDNKDQQLRKRIQQYNKIMKPNREKEGRQRRSRRNEGQKQGHKRKVRTTITQAKLDQMNKIFSLFLQNREKNKSQSSFDDDYLGSQQHHLNQHDSLKSIGEKLGLGYSTILHKFRQFRATKKVKGGALIAAMHQKRKYRKSKQIQQLIAQSLRSHKFYTAVELSKYIEQTHKITLSRSIISRHLGQMGFSYKNIKVKMPNKNSSNVKELRKRFALSLSFGRERKNAQIYYLDQLCLNLKQFIKPQRQEQSQQASELVLLALANKNGILKFIFKNGLITASQFQFFLQQSVQMISNMNQTQGPQLIVLDFEEKIHYSEKIKAFREQIRENNTILYYLPPHSSQMNMLEWLYAKIKQQLLSQQYENIEHLNLHLRDIVKELMSPCQSNMVQTSLKESQEYLTKACFNRDFDP